MNVKLWPYRISKKFTRHPIYNFSKLTTNFRFLSWKVLENACLLTKTTSEINQPFLNLHENLLTDKEILVCYLKILQNLTV